MVLLSNGHLHSIKNHILWLLPWLLPFVLKPSNMSLHANECQYSRLYFAGKLRIFLRFNVLCACLLSNVPMGESQCTLSLRWCINKRKHWQIKCREQIDVNKVENCLGFFKQNHSVDYKESSGPLYGYMPTTSKCYTVCQLTKKQASCMWQLQRRESTFMWKNID